MSTQKKRRAPYVFVVRSTEWITPHMVRVVLGGPEFDAFAALATERASTDLYVKLLFAKPELGLTPPYDMDQLRGELAPEDMPSRRTYTVRSIDREEQTFSIDFVVHGEEGIAGPWAARATPGDLVCLSGPGGKYAPGPEADEHLFFGDEAALPAIATASESLPVDARGLALIEVGSAADEIPFAAPAGVEVRWLHRDGAPHGSVLVDAVESLAAPTTDVDVFAHGERAAMKRLRPLFQKEWGLDRSVLSLSAYWAAGRVEDAFQAEKREPIGQIFEPEPRDATPRT